MAGLRGESHPPWRDQDRRNLSLLGHIEARLDQAHSGVRRKPGAAIGDTRRSGAAVYEVDTTVVTTWSDAPSFPALVATGRGDYARRAANHEKDASQKRIGC